VFALMIAAVFGVLHFLPSHGQGGNFYGFLLSFMALFVLSGIGNGTTFRMIPVIFRTLHERWSANDSAEGKAAAAHQASIESAARGRLLRCDRRLRRLLHPQELRLVHHLDRQPGHGAVRLRCFLRHLPGRDLVVVLPARCRNPADDMQRTAAR
jgi:hypothetical protein